MGAIKALGTFEHVTPTQEIKNSCSFLKTLFIPAYYRSSGFSTLQWFLVLYPKIESCYWGWDLQTPENWSESLKHIKWLRATRITARMTFKWNSCTKSMMLLKSFLGGIARVMWYRLKSGRRGRDYGIQWTTAGRRPCQKFVCSMWYPEFTRHFSPFSLSTKLSKICLEGLPSSLLLLHHKSMKYSYI